VATEAKSSDKKDLVGIDQTTVDQKGRILLAKKFRERLDSKVAITLGQKNCLNVYPIQAWQGFLDEIKGFDKTNPHAQDYARLAVAYADDDVDIDSGGRLTINSILRKKVNLGSNITIIGNIDHLEIWGTEEFERYEQGIGDRSEAMQRAYNGMVQKH
jgi:MraZ protein